MTRWSRAKLVFVCLTLGAAFGQNELWTVQTAAHRDFRDAQSVAGSLVGLGFDAYTEFAMDQGRQFVRVRIGCFTGRSAAADLAEAIGARITAEAVPVPLTPQAAVVGCVRVDIGFRKPAVWRQLVADNTAFVVEVAGATATITHSGFGWQLSQGTVRVLAEPTSGASEQFLQSFPNGLPVVQVVTSRGPVTLCPGRLLDVVARVAIVEQERAVVACLLEAVPAGTN